MQTEIQGAPDRRAVLSKAFLKAGKLLGLSRAELGHVVGKDRTSLMRGLEPDSKAGELALLLIRCYRSLYALVGGGTDDIRHWMQTPNRDIGGIPADQIMTVQGLVEVVAYLDAVRGRG